MFTSVLERYHEQRQQEEAAGRQKLILATVANARYIGTIAQGDERQRLRLIFTEQEGVLIRAEASNPDRPTEKQTFVGELVFDAKPEEDGSLYPIVMSPIGGIEDTGAWRFYCRRKGSLKLRLTDIGLEGEAYTMALGRTDFTIRLQREGKIGQPKGKKSTTTKEDAPSPIPPDRP